MGNASTAESPLPNPTSELSGDQGWPAAQPKPPAHKQEGSTPSWGARRGFVVFGCALTVVAADASERGRAADPLMYGDTF